MASWELTPTEGRVIDKLRELVSRHDNFCLSIYGQGSVKKRVLDYSWQVRERLESSRNISLAVDD